MGSSMAKNLVAAGHTVNAYNRSIEKCKPLEEFGINVFQSIGECVKNCQAVCSIVSYPKDVEEVYTGKGGIFANAENNALLIDMTTSSPLLAEKLHRDAPKEKNFKILDAPVSGGDTGARNASLSIMVGGDKADFDTALPLFEALGKNIVYMGNAGSGQHCKIANQIAIAGTIASCAEAIQYSLANNLDGQIVLNAVSKGAAGSWQMDNNAPKMLTGDYAPGFFTVHFVKDMKIAKEVMAEQGKSLPVLDMVLDLYEKLIEKGHGADGTQSIIEIYR